MFYAARVKELLQNPDMPDEEAQEVWDGFYQLAQIIYEKWCDDLEAKEQDDRDALNEVEIQDKTRY